jgi:hypothetical protein
MGIFAAIMDKIFHHPVQNAAPASVVAPPTAGDAPVATSAPAVAAQPVDVEKVLTDMAAQAGGRGNWQTSIVDLLKLLGLDSSLIARQQLATELNVHDGADGTAAENIALHRAVMQKLAENGGQVPASLKG